MNVSREFAIDTLKSVRKSLGDWNRELEKPEVLVDGKAHECYPGGVPKGISVANLEGVPMEQFRAELLAMAGMLEALATAQ